MGATLDPVRRRLYLEAMGIQVWRRRAGAPAGEGDEAPRDAGQVAGPLPAAASLSSGAPSANRVSTAPEAPRLPITPNSPFSPTARSGPGAPVPARVDTAAPTVEVSTLGWDELRAAVATCRACGLCATRTQTVFGVGRPDAALMLIGEAPGAEEDRRGEPFVGRAGQLLDRMLAAIGLDCDQVSSPTSSSAGRPVIVTPSRRRRRPAVPFCCARSRWCSRASWSPSDASPPRICWNPTRPWAGCVGVGSASVPLPCL